MKSGDMTDGIFLMHIVDALRETIEFTAGIDLKKFLDTKLLIRAVTSSFEIAGEATKNLWQSGLTLLAFVHKMALVTVEN